MTVHTKRWFIYALLFTLLAISMLDRINMSVAGSSIAREMSLSPTALGYLFSSFLWIYILCLLPAGAITDWLGTRKAIAFAVGLWSVAQMGSGFAGSLMPLLVSRLGLGVFESFTNPGANSVIREWAPKKERGLASAIWISGSLAGPSAGAVLVAWLVSDFGWRISFVITGLIGLAWVCAWLLIFRRPEDTSWLSPDERTMILAERDAPRAENERSIGYRGLLSSPTMWGLFLTQGCLTYTAYFFLTWLPSYMQMARGMTIMGSGIYTALPYGLAIVFCIALSHVSDRLLTPQAQHNGLRRYAVAFGSLATASVLATPFVESTAAIVALLTIALTFSGASQSWNFALTNDLLRTPADTGRAFAFLTLGGNSFGILAPIVTGYLVSGTGSFTIPFIVCGVLALAGAFVALLGARMPIGETAASTPVVPAPEIA
ncbi:MAG TPA: MFS transporter [Rhodopila sp.]|uniref:MFS transporter n=1 Tax=Rhodopila sp. TaxID=2480087 RepID=UPI002C319B97|nr:MFS transporter [Rhodopila sp.]HVY13994.1 MFS transporter [Rhodopila sp.]